MKIKQFSDEERTSYNDAVHTIIGAVHGLASTMEGVIDDLEYLKTIIDSLNLNEYEEEERKFFEDVLKAVEPADAARVKLREFQAAILDYVNYIDEEEDEEE